MASQTGYFNVQEFTDAGTPLVGGMLYTYAYGTTTQKLAYTDAAGLVPHTYTLDANLVPYIALNARGELPAPLYLLSGSYDLALKRADGSSVWTRRADGSDLATSSGSSLVGFLQSGTGAVLQTTQDKMREWVNVLDFAANGVSGARVDPTGVLDSTLGILAALAASKHVIVPAGCTPLISSTITVPANTCLEFQGAPGNTSTTYPSSYFIKKSTMTTVGIKLLDNSRMSLGGVVGQLGNTGDGIQIAGNAALAYLPFAAKVGGVGIRVGTDGVYANTNCFELNMPRAYQCGSHGIYVHDGVSVDSADANAGTLYQPIANQNGGDGIRLGHCFWVSVINGLAEGNTGYGLRLSGVANATYPECRWATIAGGDYNEGNTAGQIIDESYFSLFFNPDPNNVPINAGNAQQGSGLRAVLGGVNNLIGLTAKTRDGTSPFTVDGGHTGGLDYPSIIKRQTSATNGDGAGMKVSLSADGSTYRDALAIGAFQQTTDVYGASFVLYKTGAVTPLVLDANASAVRPGTDNAWSSGGSSFRWTVVYSATGTINTSDARQKQQDRPLSDRERAVAIKARILLKAFKFNDAVDAKGDQARVHFGIYAQELIAAFESEGLDPMAYAVVCYDEWDAQPEILDSKSGVVTQPARPAGNAYGVRYDELFAFILAAL